MDGRQALRHVADASGLSRRALSLSMGRSEGFVQGYLSTGRVPSVDLMAEVAHACGYKLQLVGHGETITLDGMPERGEHGAPTGSGEGDTRGYRAG